MTSKPCRLGIFRRVRRIISYLWNLPRMREQNSQNMLAMEEFIQASVKVAVLKIKEGDDAKTKDFTNEDGVDVKEMKPSGLAAPESDQSKPVPRYSGLSSDEEEQNGVKAESMEVNSRFKPNRFARKNQQQSRMSSSSSAPSLHSMGLSYDEKELFATKQEVEIERQATEITDHDVKFQLFGPEKILDTFQYYAGSVTSWWKGETTQAGAEQGEQEGSSAPANLKAFNEPCDEKHHEKENSDEYLRMERDIRGTEKTRCEEETPKEYADISVTVCKEPENARNNRSTTKRSRKKKHEEVYSGKANNGQATKRGTAPYAAASQASKIRGCVAVHVNATVEGNEMTQHSFRSNKRKWRASSKESARSSNAQSPQKRKADTVMDPKETPKDSPRQDKHERQRLISALTGKTDKEPGHGSCGRIRLNYERAKPKKPRRPPDPGGRPETQQRIQSSGRNTCLQLFRSNEIAKQGEAGETDSSLPPGDDDVIEEDTCYFGEHVVPQNEAGSNSPKCSQESQTSNNSEVASGAQTEQQDLPTEAIDQITGDPGTEGEEDDEDDDLYPPEGHWCGIPPQPASPMHERQEAHPRTPPRPFSIGSQQNTAGGAGNVLPGLNRIVQQDLRTEDPFGSAVIEFCIRCAALPGDEHTCPALSFNRDQGRATNDDPLEKAFNDED